MTPEVDGFVGGVNQAPHTLPRRRAGPSIATHDERFAVLLRNMVHVQQRFIGKAQVASFSGHGRYTTMYISLAPKSLERGLAIDTRPYHRHHLRS